MEKNTSNQKTVPSKDAYKGLSKEQLIELLHLRDKQIAERKQKLADLDKKIAERNQQIAERKQLIAEQERKIAERSQLIAERNQLIAARERQIAANNQKIAMLDKRFNASKALVQYPAETARDINDKGCQLIKNDFALSVGAFSYQAENVSDLLCLSIQEVIEQARILSNHAQEHFNSITESNNGNGQSTKVGSSHDELPLCKVSIEKDIEDSFLESSGYSTEEGCNTEAAVVSGKCLSDKLCIKDFSEFETERSHSYEDIALREKPALAQLLLNAESCPDVLYRLVFHSEEKSTSDKTTELTKSSTAQDADQQLTKAWSECAFRQVDVLLLRTSTSHPVKAKATALLTAINNASKTLKELFQQIDSVPDDVMPSEQMALFMQKANVRFDVMRHRLYLQKFIEEFGSKLNSSLRTQLSNAMRQMDECISNRKDYGRGNKPSVVVRNCKPPELIHENGIAILHPAAPGLNEYGNAGAFKECKATVGMMFSLITLISQWSLSKSHLHKMCVHCGLDLPEQHGINWILGFVRAYMHPAAIAIKQAILKNSNAVLMDEFTLKVSDYDEGADNHESSQPTQHAKLSDSSNTLNSGIRRAHVLSLVSPWTSPVTGVYCMLNHSRNHMLVFNQLKEAGLHDCYLTTDGYRDHETAIKKLRELGCNVSQTPCWAQLRRPLHQYLEETGLLAIYNEHLLPKDSNFFADFHQKLNELQNEKSIKLSRLDSNLLWLYYDINVLYAIDTAVVLKHKQNYSTDEFKRELKDARQRYSSVILNCIYDIIYMTSQDCPEVLSMERTEQGLKFKENPSSQVGKALKAILNCYENAWQFIEHPELELSENLYERFLGSGEISQQTSRILSVRDGDEAYCDFLTLFSSCCMNGLSFYDYFLWLVANVHYRIRKISLDSSVLMVPSPKVVTITDEDGHERTQTLSLYDKDNSFIFDKVDMTGLLPHDYRRYVHEYNESVLKESK